MWAFQRLSVTRKLQLIIVLASTVTLLLASVAFEAKDIITFRQAIASDLSSLARVIGMNSSGALVFYDQRTAEKNLAALQVKPHVYYACIYDRYGEVFATFSRYDAVGPIVPPAARDNGHYFENEHLYLFHRILLEEEMIGTVFIQYDMEEIGTRIRQSWGIVATIIAVAVLAALMLSFPLQRVISQPILKLAKTARTISQDKDYSVRAEKRSQDEIGVLIDGFNKMLTEIQIRDNELKDHREHLEEQVAGRTAELQQQQTVLEQTLERTKRLAVEADAANLAKSEFIANMSHEIRTPMNAILGFTDLLFSVLSDQKQIGYLESIKSSGKNLLTLINDILDLSKIEAGKMDLQYESVSPHTVFDEMKNIFSLRIAEKDLEFIMDIAPGIPQSLLLDEVRLRQVLFNLIGNAVKFTDNGYIKLTAKPVLLENDVSRINLVIAVEDTGIGIMPDSLETIFNAFKQQDGQSTKKYGGTGLGLAISKRLVEMMNGTLSVKSTVHAGSTFEIILRNVSIAATTPKPKAVNAFDFENITFAKAVMLLVDDIEINRKLIKEFFLDTNISIIEAENGEEAVRLAGEYRPDIILMDIKMPVMDGYDATKEIKKNEALQKIPVIALTASGMKKDKEKVSMTGFNGYLMKPVQIADLFFELSRFLKHTKASAPAREIHTQASVAAMSQDALDNLPEVLAVLESSYMRTWENARKSGFFNDIADFGKSIRKLGEQYSLGMLTGFGTKVAEHVGSFDIENINTTLDSFPQIIDTIKQLLQQQGKG